MHLTDDEKRMLDGGFGAPRRLAIEQQMAVAGFFDAPDFVPVTQAHLMADGEAVGEAGLAVLERIAAAPAAERRVRIPTVTDPRGVDFAACLDLRQPAHADPRERRIVVALEAIGCLMTNTCINYQTVSAPVLGEHVAFGDTGSSIYANSVCGARTNFEGGVAALWAGLTGRVPRYGMHLDAARRGTRLFHLDDTPRGAADWGALGGVIGRRMRSYFDVPVITGVTGTPGATALKFFGAALASYGSTPLFHMVGVTPEAPALAAISGLSASEAEVLGQADIDEFYAGFDATPGLDLVVLSAPQLSLYELAEVADLLSGRRVQVPFIVTAPHDVAQEAERLGIARRLREAGATMLVGVCFYQMYAREMGEANGWRRLLTSSSKLANILGGYGYRPRVAPLEACVQAAVAGASA